MAGAAAAAVCVEVLCRGTVYRTRLVCLGETPSPRVRCRLALFTITYLLTLEVYCVFSVGCIGCSRQRKATGRGGAAGAPSAVRGRVRRDVAWQGVPGRCREAGGAHALCWALTLRRVPGGPCHMRGGPARPGKCATPARKFAETRIALTSQIRCGRDFGFQYRSLRVF